MNEQLTVKNFGPIKDATVDFKRVTVFIGPTGGGKSTLAKLAAVFRKGQTNESGHFDADLSFSDVSIENYIQPITSIDWANSKGVIINLGNPETMNLDNMLPQEKSAYNVPNEELNNFIADKAKINIDDIEHNILSELESNGVSNVNEQELKDLIISIKKDLEKKVVNAFYKKNVFPLKSHYVPTERIFIAAISKSWAGIVNNEIGLPKTLSSFANTYFQARESINSLYVPFLKINYLKNEEQDLIINEESVHLKISEVASGIQSTVPMIVVLEHLSRQKEQAQSFIIEEPELNLYPTAQQGLMNWLVEKCTAGENDLTITTHSPYILASCNLLMEAYKVWQDRPELETEIEQIVPRASWINPDEFAAYYVADGTVRSIKDERTDLIGGNELDAVSGKISDAFRSLLRLKKQPA